MQWGTLSNGRPKRLAIASLSHDWEGGCGAGVSGLKDYTEKTEEHYYNPHRILSCQIDPRWRLK
jgi:hypothetical protein